MDNLLEKLNKEQLKAVQHDEGPLLIIAGAGTGKTTVITQRIAYLIEQGKARSDEILALTFTEKAAGEMEERVDKLLPMGYLDLWISTFHSFGERILDAHGVDIGLSPEAKLLNEFEQWSLIKKNLDKFNLHYYRPLGNPTKFIQALVKHFSRAKDEDISPAQYLEFANELQENLDTMLGGNKKKKAGNFEFRISNFETDDKEIAAQEVARINEVANAYHVYQQLLLDNQAMDFGDLINYTLKIFRERPAVLEKYRQQFKYILLDEFQDTNWAQYELVKLLAAPNNNLVVVGDDDQSIYKFRGASISNIMQFKKDYPKSKETVLIKNYRNTQNILDLAYDFIQLNNPNRLEVQLKSKTKQLSKKLKAENKSKGVIEVIQGKDLQDEIRQVVEKVADNKLKDKESSWNDFGILVRANESAKEICAYLDVAGLPYQFLASRGLYTKSVIMDVVAYLKLLDNYHEGPAVYRILNIPVFDFSYQELVNFNYWAKKKSWSLYEVLKSARSFKVGEELINKIEKLLSLIEKHSSLTREKTVSEIVLAFLNDSGYLKYLTEQEERLAQENLGYLNRFMKRIKEFEAGSEETNVKAFLEELNMAIEAGEQGNLVPDIDSGPEAIKVMTVHGAKGLEFKYVFITNMVDKRFPTISRKEAILIPDALVKEMIPEGDIHLEEERRLFYVALTRAKRGLFLSWAPDYGGARKKKPSRFLDETNLVNLEAKDSKEKKEKGDEYLTIKKRPEFGEDKFELTPPAYYSYTQLTAFNNCPYQYRFAHVLKVPRGSRHTLSFGQSMHLALQKLFQLIIERRGFGQDSLFGASAPAKSKEKIKITIEEILKLYKESWIDNWYESKSQKKEYWKLGEESLKEFFNKHQEEWPNVISLEQGINLKLEGYRIYGKIDRVDDRGEEGISIIDYKTGTPKNPDKISVEDKEQLLLYQLAMKQINKRPICNLQFYYLNDNSEINFVGTDKDLSDMEGKTIQRILQIEDAFRGGVFPPKPGPLCKYCDYFHICEFRKS